MSSTAIQTARDAGFLTRDDILGKSVTSSTQSPDGLGGMKLVASELLPEGWWGLSTSKGAVLCGPEGQLINVPFEPFSTQAGSG